jgi:hypothetical protein
MLGELEPTPSQSPRTKAFMQHFEHKVRLHTDGINEDVQVTNERLGQLESAHIDTNSKLNWLETTQIATYNNLAALET